MRQKVGGVLCPFPCGESWSPSNNVTWAEAYLGTSHKCYLHAKFHLDPSLEPFRHNTPTLQTDSTGQTDRQTDKWSPKNDTKTD